MSDHLRAHETAAPMLDGPSGPLHGIRILDVTHAAAGPFGAMMLADLGADVIKVEPPGGELVRFGAPKPLDETEHRYSGRYANRNRNKRSIVLDLADDADRETFLQLVETADGLIENMRAGVLDRLGVGWEVCHARNPRLVYAAVRGFGDPRTGASPYGEWPAFDAVAQAMGGFVAMTGPDADHPLRTGPAVGDLVPGLMAAFGLVAAALARAAQRSGPVRGRGHGRRPDVDVRAGPDVVDLQGRRLHHPPATGSTASAPSTSTPRPTGTARSSPPPRATGSCCARRSAAPT